MKDRKNEPDNQDDDYHFCMQVQGSLKRLDSRKKAMAKLYIHQYLTSLELELDYQPTYHQPLVHSSQDIRPYPINYES